jgi:hypothetical protein
MNRCGNVVGGTVLYVLAYDHLHGLRYNEITIMAVDDVFLSWQSEIVLSFSVVLSLYRHEYCPCHV